MVPRVKDYNPLRKQRTVFLVGRWGPQGKLQNSITYHLLNNRRHFIAVILPIRRKTLNNQLYTFSFLTNLIWIESSSGCHPSINFSHFHHFLQNHLANFNNLNTKHPWVKGIQVCPNEGSRLFPRGRYLCKSENKLTKFKNLLLHNYVIAENL